MIAIATSATSKRTASEREVHVLNSHTSPFCFKVVQTPLYDVLFHISPLKTRILDSGNHCTPYLYAMNGCSSRKGDQGNNQHNHSCEEPYARAKGTMHISSFLSSTNMVLDLWILNERSKHGSKKKERHERLLANVDTCHV